jgi:hypothetical protein
MPVRQYETTATSRMAGMAASMPVAGARPPRRAPALASPAAQVREIRRVIAAAAGTCRALSPVMSPSLRLSPDMAPDELHTDILESLWDKAHDIGDTTQIIDLELEEIDERYEMDDRDGRDDASDYEANLD